MPTLEDDATDHPTSSRGAWPWLLAEVLLSVLLGAWALGSKSLWLDEGFSAMASSDGWSGAVGDTIDKRNMVGYHLALSGWRVLGDSEVVLRSLSVVAFAGTVLATYFLVTRLFGTTTALRAGFLVSIAPFAVRYAQEVRSYAAVMCAVTVATLCFVVALERQRARWWVLYAFVAAAACYLHFFAGFVLVAHALSLVAWPRARLPLRQLLWTALLLVALLVPMVVLVTSVDASETSGAPTLRSLVGVPGVVAGGAALAIVVLGFALVAVVMLVRAIRDHHASPDTWRLALVVAWMITPFGAALAALVVIGPNWKERYFIVALPAILVAAAVGIGVLRDRRLIAATLVLMIVLAGVRIAELYRTDPQQNWRALVKEMAHISTAEDGIVFCDPWSRPPFEYYALRHGTDSLPRPLSPADPWGGGVHPDGATSATVGTGSGAPARIWVVSPYPGFQATGACNLDTTMAGRELSVDRSIGDVFVRRYDADR